MGVKRLLFVDDEPNILNGLRHRLRRQRTKWELVFVDGPLKALEYLARESVDVIVADMRMPEMDGADLLDRVRKSYPHVTRVILSGHAEKCAALKAAAVAHQYLSKPCGEGELERVIERITALQSATDQTEVRRVVGAIAHLPSPPRIYGELTATIDQESASIPQVAEILRKDMALCAKLLHMVNSAFFRLPRTVSRVEEALTYLGLDTTKQLVLALETFKGTSVPAHPKMPIDAMQSHALQVGRVASAICDSERSKGDALVAGILHDFGKLVLTVSAHKELDEIFARVASHGGSMWEAEYAVLGATHAQVGGYLLGLWGLPSAIVDAATFHHAPALAGNNHMGLTGVVHIADALVHELHHAATGPGWLDIDYCESVGISGRLSEWRQLVAPDGQVETS